MDAPHRIVSSFSRYSRNSTWRRSPADNLNGCLMTANPFVPLTFTLATRNLYQYPRRKCTKVTFDWEAWMKTDLKRFFLNAVSKSSAISLLSATTSLPKSLRGHTQQSIPTCFVPVRPTKMKTKKLSRAQLLKLNADISPYLVAFYSSFKYCVKIHCKV